MFHGYCVDRLPVYMYQPDNEKTKQSISDWGLQHTSQLQVELAGESHPLPLLLSEGQDVLEHHDVHASISRDPENYHICGSPVVPAGSRRAIIMVDIGIFHIRSLKVDGFAKIGIGIILMCHVQSKGWTKALPS